MTLSRNRRWIRVDTVRRNQVATADTQRPKAASAHQRVVALDHTVAEQREPEREQRVGQRGQQGRTERERHEARLVLVPELAEPPHRREGGRELVVGRRLR